MVIKAPPETQLQAVDSSEVRPRPLILTWLGWCSAEPQFFLSAASAQNFQISLRSKQGPIDVFLCPEESVDDISPGKLPSQGVSSGEEDRAADPVTTVSEPSSSSPAADPSQSLLSLEQGG